MLKLLNVLEILGLFGSFWDCIGLLLGCFALRCGCVDRYEVVAKCFGSALGLYRVAWECLSL